MGGRSYYFPDFELLLTDFFLEAVIFVPGYIVLIAVLLPFQFKFGGEKGRIAMLMACGIAFLTVYFSVKGLQMIGIDVEEIIDSLPVLHQGLLELLAFVVSVVALLVSAAISSRIMCSKEF